MKLICSDKLEDVFRECRLVRNLREVKAAILDDGSDVECVILHSIDGGAFEAGVFISEVHQEHPEILFLYINETPDLMLSMAVQGADGVVSNDEFFLESEEDLLVYLEDLNGEDGGTAVAVSSSVITVRDFVEAFTRNDPRLRVPAYLANVNKALDDLELTTVNQKQELQQLSVSALGVFQRAADIINKLNAQKVKISEKFQELQNAVSMDGSSTREPLGGVAFYPTVKVMTTNPVLLFREFCPSRFLTSFVLAYVDYLHLERNKRVKLIICIGREPGILSKYAQYATITQESEKMISLQNADIVVTNIPKRELVVKLVKAPADVTIVLDRLYGKTPIISGKVRQIGVCSGLSDVARYKEEGCDLKDTLFPLSDYTKIGAFGCIPVIKSYPSEPDARLARYHTQCRALYEKIDKFAGVVE